MVHPVSPSFFYFLFLYSAMLPFVISSVSIASVCDFFFHHIDSVANLQLLSEGLIYSGKNSTNIEQNYLQTVNFYPFFCIPCKCMIISV